jgi:hypothetical protein
MYWSIASFPELQHLEETDRRKILTNSGSRRILIRMVWLSITVGAILSVISMQIMGLLTWPILLAAFLFWAPAVYQFQIILVRGQLRLYLERAARRQKLPLCLNCGYNIEGLQSERCPECGAVWDHSKSSNGHT